MKSFKDLFKVIVLKCDWKLNMCVTAGKQWKDEHELVHFGTNNCILFLLENIKHYLVGVLNRLS